MMLLIPFVLASCLALNTASDQITAGDLATAFPGLQSIAPETPLAFAPAPGVVRVFHIVELRRIAARWSIPAPDTDICIARPVAPLEPERLLAAMRQSLPEANIEIREFSRRPAPAGEIEFPATGLHVAPSSTLWNGAVIYGRNHRFPIWARVEVRIRQTCITPLRDLIPNQPVAPEAVQLETRELLAALRARAFN